MDKRYQVKHYIAVVRNGTGLRFTVLETADPQWYLFVPMIGETSSMGSLQIPVLKKDLRDDIRHALANGRGND